MIWLTGSVSKETFNLQQKCKKLHDQFHFIFLLIEGTVFKQFWLPFYVCWPKLMITMLQNTHFKFVLTFPFHIHCWHLFYSFLPYSSFILVVSQNKTFFIWFLTASNAQRSKKKLSWWFCCYWRGENMSKFFPKNCAWEDKNILTEQRRGKKTKNVNLFYGLLWSCVNMCGLVICCIVALYPFFSRS